VVRNFRAVGGHTTLSITGPWLRAVRNARENPDLLAAVVSERLQADIESYRELPSDRVIEGIRNNILSVLHVVEGRRTDLTEEERMFFIDGGGIRARQHLPAEDVMRAWFIAAHEAFEFLVSSARELGAKDTQLLAQLGPFHSVFENATVAFIEGHREADLVHSRDEERRRNVFVERILNGVAEIDELASAIDHWHLDAHVPYRAFRAHFLSSNVESAAARSELEASLGLITAPGAKRRGLAVMIDNDLCGFTSVTQSVVVSSTVIVGLGHSVNLDSLVRSFHGATRALATAVAFGHSGANTFDALGVRPAIVADSEVSDALLRRWIDPVLTDSRSGATILATVESYLDHGMRNDVTATAAFIHHNTLRYRLDRFERISGADLRDTETLVAIWWALQVWRIREKEQLH
jgi:sugar diacid utilization regulator